MKQHSIKEPFISAAERVRLVRYCASLSSSSDVAEDLAQETLLEAWKHEQSLRDPSRRAQWLAGIARNVYLRWQRQQGREQSHRYQATTAQQEQHVLEAEHQLFIATNNLEEDLERQELLELLERALLLLPAETRMALIRHYVDGSSLTEVSQQLGTNTNALAVRLQRGKTTMRRLLMQDMQQEFTEHCPADTHAGWEVTPLWCYHCGTQRMLGKRLPDEGKLWLTCPLCSPDMQQLLSRNELPLLQGMKSYQPMLTKLRHWCHEHYRAALAVYTGNGMIRCETCTQPLIIHVATMAQYPEYLQTMLQDMQGFGEGKLVSTFCPHCQNASTTTLSGLVLNLPEARMFARTQSRIRTLPARAIETQGRSALLIRLESVVGNAALNVISDEETYAVLRIEQEGF